MTEAAVCHIELHLSEDCLRFDTSSPSVFESFLRGQQFACLSFIFVESMVYLDCTSVAFGFIAQAPQRAAFAILCAVTCVFAAIAACGLGVGSSDARHVLAHRADVIVFISIVMEVVVMEGIGFVARALFDMETVVLDISLHAGIVHEAVVLFRAVAGVGHCGLRQMPVTVEE